jgi:hypothetical protein
MKSKPIRMGRKRRKRILFATIFITVHSDR